MEAPLHQFPVPLPAQDALLLQQAVAARALMMAGAGNNNAAPLLLPATTAAALASMGPGREQCPRCASRDTKFCYFPVGGSSTRTKRHRPSRAAMAAAVAAAATPTPTITTTAGRPFAPSSPATTTLQMSGLLASSLLLGGSVPASSALASSPLLALGAAPPLLEGRLGYDLGLGEAALLAAGGGATGDLAHQQQQLAGPLCWPAAAETTTWKAASSGFVFPYEFPPATAALWQHQELAAAAPVVVAAGGLNHGGAPHLLL